MVKIFIKVGIEQEEYRALMKAIKEGRYASPSHAGRRGFWLLRLEREGHITIAEHKKKDWE